MLSKSRMGTFTANELEGHVPIQWLVMGLEDEPHPSLSGVPRNDVLGRNQSQDFWADLR